MAYVYQLAGENLELAEAEIKGFLRSQDIYEIPERESRLVFTDSEPKQLKKLGLTHRVSRVIEERDDLKFEYRPEGSFSVRAYRLDDDTDSNGEEERVGEVLETDQNSVDLEDPDTKIDLYIQNGNYILAENILDIDRGLFRQRRNQHRPFSSPVSLDPVLGRVMVNLSETPPGGEILDPFCGTGGILIEAGLCGIMPYGTDLQQEMVEGAKENLKSYGVLNYKIEQLDIAEADQIFEGGFNAVVTDLPYGKASKTENNPVKSFLKHISESKLEKIVFMYNEPEIGNYSSDYEIYVHKNLTRYIFVI